MAFGGDSVHAIKMPSKWSSDHSVKDAIKLHEAFGVNDYTVKIDHEPWLGTMNVQLRFDEIVDLHPADSADAGKPITRKLVDYNKVADENIQARQRGQVVMHFSNATGALPLTTGNKTELALGYSTLYGDMNGGFNPIGDLYKLEVYELATLINKYYGKEMIPRGIMCKAPSAELAPGQTDEASLLPYKVLDPIIKAYVEDYVDSWESYQKWVVENKVLYQDEVIKFVSNDANKEKFDYMIRRTDNMEFKRRQAAPCTRVTKKAFGTGRRLPIVKKWRG
jgi:NAD+ synthase (glutamine-hydrolysing)